MNHLALPKVNGQRTPLLGGLKNNMKLIKSPECSGTIMSLLEGAEKRFVAVSPWVNTQGWEKFRIILNRCLSRGLEIKFFIRAGDGPTKIELKSLSVPYFEVPNLHAKLYFNESRAIVTSLNLLHHSDVQNIEIGLMTETFQEYSEVFSFFETSVFSGVLGEKPDNHQVKKAVSIQPTKPRAVPIEVEHILKEGLSCGKKIVAVSYFNNQLRIDFGTRCYFVFRPSDATYLLKMRCDLNRRDFIRLKQPSNEHQLTINLHNIEFLEESRGSKPAILTGGKFSFREEGLINELLFNTEVMIGRLDLFITSIEKMSGQYV